MALRDRLLCAKRGSSARPPLLNTENSHKWNSMLDSSVDK